MKTIINLETIFTELPRRNDFIEGIRRAPKRDLKKRQS